LATYAVLMISPIGALEKGILILFACLPPAIFNFMLADKFSVQPDKVASTVIVGHLISVLALPFGLWLALQ
jgi:predicted permease